MIQQSSQLRPSRLKQIIQLFFVLLSVIAAVALVIHLSYGSDETLLTEILHADEMALIGFILCPIIPIIGLFIIIFILLKSYIRNKFPSKIPSTFKLFVVLIFIFVIIILISDLINFKIRQRIYKNHYNNIASNIKQEIQFEHIPVTANDNQKIIDDFSQNNMVVKVGEKTDFQYYYFDNNNKELALIPLFPFLSNKDIWKYAVSPSQNKLVINIFDDNYFYVFNKTKNYILKIGFNQQYSYLHFFSPIFDEDEKLILSYSTGPTSFSDIGAYAVVDLNNEAVESTNRDAVTLVEKDNTKTQNDSCSYLQENIYISEELPIKQGCIYYTINSDSNSRIVKFFDVSTKETKTLLEVDKDIEFLQPENSI